MYYLTELGKADLAKYKNASTYTLQLNRRTLINPVMVAIEDGNGNNSFAELKNATGYEHYLLLNILGALFKMRYIDTTTTRPPRGSTKKPSSRETYERQLKLYPEFTKKKFEEFTTVYQRKYKARMMREKRAKPDYKNTRVRKTLRREGEHNVSKYSPELAHDMLIAHTLGKMSYRDISTQYNIPLGTVGRIIRLEKEKEVE